MLLWLIGWTLGWLLFVGSWLRPSPRTGPVRDHIATAVIVPARDEAANIGAVIANLQRQIGGHDQLVVIDDDSSDGTGQLAAAAHADVITAPPKPAGWAGKTWACHSGAVATTGEILVFIDADVRPAAGALRNLIDEAAATDGLVSVQPWHHTNPTWGQLSLLPNLLAVAGLSFVRHPRYAFGPVLAVSRAAYERVDGFAAPSVKNQTVEDAALARLFAGRVILHAGRRWASFDMHSSARQMFDGWTRVLGHGAVTLPPVVMVATVWWVGALSGGPFEAWWIYLVNAAQLAVLGRRVGRFHVGGALMYPLSIAVVVAAVARGRLRRTISWKGRFVPRG